MPRHLSYVFIVAFAIIAASCSPTPTRAICTCRKASPTLGGGQRRALYLSSLRQGSAGPESSADYSLSEHFPRHPEVDGSAAAPGGPSALLEPLGATVYLVSPSASATTGLQDSFASLLFWLLRPAGLPRLFCINTIVLYLSGVTLQGLGLALKQ